jgi:hypothetical protein
MADNEYISMLVCWKEQRRVIKINIDDDINTIEKTISKTFQLEEVDGLSEYQIQYFDNEHQRFIDLYPDTLNPFRQLVQKLLSPEAPPKSNREWFLKIVSKTVETIRTLNNAKYYLTLFCSWFIGHTIHESINDDTYSYQQENDPTELLRNEETLPTTNNLPTSIPGTSNFI